MIISWKYGGYGNSPLERGCAGLCCGGGVLNDMLANTPLHPSQEGNRTAPALKSAYFIVIQSLNMFKRYLVIAGLLLLCSVQTAIAQNRSSLIIARDHLILQIDLNSPKKVLDSILSVAGLRTSSAEKLIKGDFSAIINDGWNMTSKTDNLLVFDRSLTDLNNNPQDNPYQVTVNIPSLEGKPGYPAKVAYGVNKYAMITVYELSSGLTRFMLPGFERSKRVFLSGNFNNWSTLKGLMKKTGGGWIIDVKLDPGVYEYKYIIDGRWTTDPNNLVHVDDGAGNLNSVYFKYNYTFKLPGYPSAHRITLAGDFNEWNGNELLMERKGSLWERQMYLAEGKYYYRFIVDGQWITDPTNPVKLKGSDNYFNSVLNLGEKVVFKLAGHSDAKKVVLEGDFGDFSPDELNLEKKGGRWILPLTLSTGNYRYRFIVDGKSVIDPSNPHFFVLKDTTWSFLAIRPNHIFTLEGHGNAKIVTLCGVFNKWQPDGYAMTYKDGKWSIPFYLNPGKYLYKFRVDGEWILDPGNKLWEQNEFNTGNSVLWIE